jgi:tryptophanyl-tRNA synthetase
MRERARPFEEDPGLVRTILVEGSERARAVARETLEEVRAVIGISHR